MGILIDATVLIDAERGRFDMRAFLDATGDDGVAIAAITASELLFGCERARDAAIRARRTAYVEGLLDTLPIIPFGLAEARRHAHIWAHLAESGTPIGPHDSLLAATALANAFSVATLNVGEFERVPGLGLVPLDPFRTA
jgi:tRNA(fMet)-specific endonuclease VapC